jgi:hypothetical protein
MSSIARIQSTAFFFLALAVHAIAQTAPAPPAPVPPQIVAAKRAFISNAGIDAQSLATFKRAGEPDEPYNEFYAAAKSWGRYELVSSPADADLIFQIRFTAPLFGCGNIDSYAPQLAMTILDAKTHFVLWSLSAPVQGAFKKDTWDKNFAKGIASIMDDLKRLANPLVASRYDAQK